MLPSCLCLVRHCLQMGFPASHWPQTAFNKIEAYGRLELLEA